MSEKILILILCGIIILGILALIILNYFFKDFEEYFKHGRK